MNLPQDPIRGSDSRIVQKTETHETTKNKFIYLARKPLSFLASTASHIKITYIPTTSRMKNPFSVTLGHNKKLSMDKMMNSKLLVFCLLL